MLIKNVVALKDVVISTKIDNVSLKKGENSLVRFHSIQEYEAMLSLGSFAETNVRPPKEIKSSGIPVVKPPKKTKPDILNEDEDDNAGSVRKITEAMGDIKGTGDDNVGNPDKDDDKGGEGEETRSLEVESTKCEECNTQMVFTSEPIKETVQIREVLFCPNCKAEKEVRKRDMSSDERHAAGIRTMSRCPKCNKVKPKDAELCKKCAEL